MDDEEVSQGYCPCCDGVHRQDPVGQIGGQQANGCDVDFTTWHCVGCGAEWSGDLYAQKPANCA